MPRARAACLLELMQRYCEGDTAAFRSLYDEIAPALRSYLGSLAKDCAVADDLLQEAFLKLHNARAAYVRGANPLPWVFTIAHRVFLDHMRRQRRARVRSTSNGEVPEIKTTLDGRRETDERETLTPRVLSTALHDAIAALPPRQRTALELTRLARLPCADAARELGITAGAVKLRVHRAVQALRRRLTGADAEWERAKSEAKSVD
jgi:RNA polymerase sigma-70 factor (ECF subfamily)